MSEQTRDGERERSGERFSRADGEIWGGGIKGQIQGLPNSIEVGDKKYYPPLEDRLNCVLREIVPLTEGIAYSSKLHAVWGQPCSPCHVYIAPSVLPATSIDECLEFGD